MSWGIHAAVGFNGSGKTLALVEKYVMPALASGREVVGNVRIGPAASVDWHPLARPLESWREVSGLRNCVLFLDEITAVLPSRSSMSLPPEFQRVLNQLRKRDVELVWSAPNWQRADRILREVTTDVIYCRSFLVDRFVRVPERGVFPKAARYDADGVYDVGGELGIVHGSPGARVRYPRSAEPQRLFRWVTFRADDFEEFSLNAAMKLRPKERKMYWRTRHEAHLTYDTLQGVSLLDHLDDVGACVVCGGSRKRAACRCGAAGSSQGASAPARPAEVTA
jgi:hypothetical protein